MVLIDLGRELVREDVTVRDAFESNIIFKVTNIDKTLRDSYNYVETDESKLI